MNVRLENLVAKMADHEVDALLIVNEINVRYLSGFTGDSSWLLVEPNQTTILSDGRYKIQIADECPDLNAVIRPPSQKLDELLCEVLGSGSLKNIGIEGEHVRVSMFDSWGSKMPEIEWKATSGVVEDLRAIKDEDEIASIRSAISIAERTFRSVVSKLSPTMTERDVHFELEATMRHLGASGVSFCPIVGAEPNGALPHYHPQDVPLGDCRTLLIDWGAMVDGYCSDLTRTLHRPNIRSSTAGRFETAYAAVLEAQEAAIEAIAAGVETTKIDSAARGVLEKAGLGDHFNHGLGHGFGLEIHESPRMGPTPAGVLREGMVVTVEPGVYFENEFGIRIEDDVLVTATGCERLSNLPKGLDDCLLVM